MGDDVRIALFSLFLHVMGPSFDTRYVTLVLRVGRRHVRMAHLRSRVRIVWIMGRGYVLHRRKWWLKLVVSDNVRLRSVFPRRLGDRLLRAVSLVRSLDLLLVSEKRYISATRNFRTKPHAYERVLPRERHWAVRIAL